MMDGGRDNIYADDNVDLSSPKFTPQTQRQRIKQAKYIASIFNADQLKQLYDERDNDEEPDEEPVLQTVPEESETVVDSIATNAGSNQVEEEPAHGIDPDQFTFEESSPALESGQVDTDNYTFGGGVSIRKR